MQTIVAEITLATDASGTTQTFLVSDGPAWATGNADTPASTNVYSRLQQPGNIQRDLFEDRATFGAVRAAYGLCEIANMDGLFDAWADYVVSGQPFVLRMGVPGTAYPSAWTTVLVATMAAIEATTSTIRVKVRDQVDLLASTKVRAGTRPDPVVFGNVLCAQPVVIDADELVYAVGRPPAGKIVLIDALQSNGVMYTAAGYDAATTIAAEADVAGTSVSSGHYNWHPASGRLKLGSAPVGVLTATLRVIDGSVGWTLSGAAIDDNSRVGTILSQIATVAGVADIDSGDVSDMDDLCGPSIEYGCWDYQQMTCRMAMDRIANSLGVYYHFDRDGTLRMGQFTEPSGTSAWTFSQHNVILASVQRVTASDLTESVPVWRVIARSAHIDSRVTAWDATAAAETKSLLSVEWPQQSVAQGSQILEFAPLARELTVDCYTGGRIYTGGRYSYYGDNGEATRRLGVFGQSTEMVTLDAVAESGLITAVDLGATVTLAFPRYDWTAGAQFRVIGIRTDLARRRITYTLWRPRPIAWETPIQYPTRLYFGGVTNDPQEDPGDLFSYTIATGAEVTPRVATTGTAAVIGGVVDPRGTTGYLIADGNGGASYCTKVDLVSRSVAWRVQIDNGSDGARTFSPVMVGDWESGYVYAVGHHEQTYPYPIVYRIKTSDGAVTTLNLTDYGIGRAFNGEALVPIAIRAGYLYLQAKQITSATWQPYLIKVRLSDLTLSSGTSCVAGFDHNGWSAYKGRYLYTAGLIRSSGYPALLKTNLTDASGTTLQIVADATATLQALAFDAGTGTLYAWLRRVDAGRLYEIDPDTMTILRYVETAVLTDRTCGSMIVGLNDVYGLLGNGGFLPSNLSRWDKRWLGHAFEDDHSSKWSDAAAAAMLGIA